MTLEEYKVITILNDKTRSSGEPPQFINMDPSMYYGYFEGEHGNQWVFVADSTGRSATLLCGSANWGRVLTIHGLDDLPRPMTEAEQDWVMACWKASRLSRKGRMKYRGASRGGSSKEMEKESVDLARRDGGPTA